MLITWFTQQRVVSAPKSHLRAVALLASYSPGAARRLANEVLEVSTGDFI